MFDRQSLTAREEQWARFHEWEASHRPRPLDSDAVWDWYQEIWELAWEVGAIPRIPEMNLRKIDEIQELRSRLARLPWPR